MTHQVRRHKPSAPARSSSGDYNGRRLELNRNPNYWQADKIKVEQLILEGQYRTPTRPR